MVVLTGKKAGYYICVNVCIIYRTGSSTSHAHGVDLHAFEGWLIASDIRHYFNLDLIAIAPHPPIHLSIHVSLANCD